MVVSGAPIRTLHHAEYVLDCTLSFLEAVREMDARFDFSLQIRCGVHTGAVIAGVVGLKMPR
jgi:atrial natriuretic peptide receptor A